MATGSAEALALALEAGGVSLGRVHPDAAVARAAARAMFAQILFKMFLHMVPRQLTPQLRVEDSGALAYLPGELPTPHGTGSCKLRSRMLA
ncbi:hypothetical protein [Arthrobacter sp.]|uniref:hypothetical protein n=1 Tax=Arthrobacter sp. TaxID=1667 RepID=UPI0026E0CDA3|nr:hypothetical protein [Arthrobacter sp.]MDO5751460.1 hypothetical protein [Arthrobacter sp.]